MNYQCPHCGKNFDQQLCVSSEEVMEPRNGDITMCIKCGKFSAFKNDALRHLTRDEKVQVATDPECFKLWLIWNATKDQNPAIQNG